MKAHKALFAAVASAAVMAGMSGPAMSLDWKSVTDDRLLNADKSGDDWLMYGRNYAQHRFSPLKEITAANASKLKPKYRISLGSIEGQELTPTANGGILLVPISHKYIDAYNAATGERMWRYENKVPADVTQFACCGLVTRGLAVYGDKVYFGTLDARMLALDAKTGKLVWEKTLQDYKAGYTITMAPQIIKGKVLIGFAGGEFGVIGQIVALDSETGNEVWKHNTIPGPGEEGYDTWGKDSAKYGGGAAWLTASYDPERNLTIWGTGNPAPWNSDMRPGANLFSNSIIALDADTGKRKWYHQQVPNDAWDWDSMNEAVLADIDINGKKTPVALQAHKNGFLYTLNRDNGAFIRATKFAHVDWGSIDAKGNMVVKEGKRPGVDKKASFCPSYFGGKGWSHMSLNPETQMLFIPTLDMCVTLHHEETTYKKGTMYLGAGGEINEPGKGALVAIDLKNDKIAWEWKHNSPLQSGATLATAGGVVFAATMEGYFIAFDQKTGKELWRDKASSGFVASPITFTAGGKQHVAIVSGYGGAFPLWAGKGIPPHIKNNVNPGAVLNVYALE